MNSISNGKIPPRKYQTRRGSAAKIEEKLSELERIKNRSVSSGDLIESNKKPISIPKVNIFQRKEIFEKIQADESSKKKPNGELPPVRSIKERLHSLEKQVSEENTSKTKNVQLSEISVKDRLSFINEKMKQSSSSEKSPNKEKCKEKQYEACNGVKHDDVMQTNREYSSGRSSSSEDYDHVQMNHFHHRSLDSLQGHDSPNGFCYERVQSLECIDCCSNYPASVLSGDTDREDSGIHTADVSSSVSQADDFDLHADASIDVVVDVKTQASASTDEKVDKSSHNDFRFDSQSVEVTQRRDTGDDGNQNSELKNNVFEQIDEKCVSVSENKEKCANNESNQFTGNQNSAECSNDAEFENQNGSELEDTLVSDDKDGKCEQFVQSNEEICCKRELKVEFAENVESMSDVTKLNGYDNGYAPVSLQKKLRKWVLNMK